MKKGLQEFKENIDDGELSFPVYGFMDQKVYSGSYGFAPLVQSPGVAMIVIGDEEGTAARMLIRSIILCWPIVFLDVMLLWVLSIVIWFVVSLDSDNFYTELCLNIDNCQYLPWKLKKGKNNNNNNNKNNNNEWEMGLTGL